MSEDIERALAAALGEIPGVNDIAGGEVPLPDPDKGMTDHLFVNVTLDGLDEDGDIGQIVKCLRDVAFESFRRIRDGVDVKAYATICLSLYTPISASASEGIRIYRTRLRSNELPNLTRENLRQIALGEESRKRAVHELLNLQTE